MANQETQLATIQRNELLNSGGIYSSIENKDQESALKIYDAVSNAEPLSDHLGQTIMVRDVVLQPIEVNDTNTGEVRQMIRSILIDEEGKALSCSSDGVLTSLKSLFTFLGEPPFVPSVPLVPMQKTGRHGYKFLTLTYQPDQKKK